MNYYFKLREGKDNSTARPLLLCTRYQGKRQYLTLPVLVLPNLWDQRRERITGTGPEMAVFTELKQRAEKYFAALVITGDAFDPAKMKAAILQKKPEKPTNTLRHYAGKYVATTALSHSVYNKYLHAVKLAEILHPGITVGEVDFDFLGRFYAFCRQKVKNETNTANKKVQRLKTILHFAQKCGEKIPENIRFFKLKTAPTFREYLTWAELSLLETEIHNPTHQLTQGEMTVLAAFVFGCFTGLRYGEIVWAMHNKQMALNDAGILVNATKTGATEWRPIPARARRIIDTGFITKVYANQKCNDYLKNICEKLKIRKSLSFHCSRHTYAVISLEMGVSVAELQRLLGHARIETTMIYAKVLQNSLRLAVDKWDERQ